MGNEKTKPKKAPNKIIYKKGKKYSVEERDKARELCSGMEWVPFLYNGFIQMNTDEIEILDTQCGVITQEILDEKEDLCT